MSSAGLLAIEAAKVLIQTFFRMMELAGKSKEEIREIFEQEHRAFKLNNPANLPEV